MKSNEVYAVLRDYLAPVFKATGFKREKTMLSWSRPCGDKHMVVWCQVSQDGWDNLSGSKFTMEFQVSDESIVGSGNSRRMRMPKMLDARGSEEIRAIQNEVIASLTMPPANHPILNISDAIRSWYLDEFRKIERPFGDGYDIWLRYHTEAHVAVWARFIIGKLPDLLRQAESWV